MKVTWIRSPYGVLTALTLASLTLTQATATPPPLPPTATFDLTGVNGLSLAGVYTSPYIGGTAGTDPKNVGPVICDDFSDNSYIPEEWTTYVTTLTDVNLGSTDTSVLKWKGADSGGTVDGSAGWNLNQATAYDVAADLIIKILAANPNPQDHIAAQERAQEDLSFALWELFAPNLGAVTADKNWGTNTDNVTGWGPLSSGDLNAATADVEAAITEVTTPGFTGLNNVAVLIYSYNQDTTTTKCGTNLGTSPCPDLPPQEFISVTPSTVVQVPEASFFDSFGLYFIAGGAGLVFLSRRRTFRTQA